MGKVSGCDGSALLPYAKAIDFTRAMSHAYSMHSVPPIIYIVNPSVAVTGGFVAACHAATFLGADARVVMVLTKKARIPPEYLNHLWRVEYLHLAGLSKNLWSMLRYVPLLLIDSWRLKKWMQYDCATTLMLNDFYLMHGVVLRLLGFRGYIVSWVRCDPARLMGKLGGILLRLAQRSANRMVAVSQFVRSLLPTHCDAAMIYDCFMGKQRPPIMWRLVDDKKFVYIGNYIAGKGQDMAIAAFAIAAARDQTIRMAFYGGDMGLKKNRAYRAQLQAEVEKHGLASRISFHDFVSDPHTVLKTAYAALNFSSSESFSLTVLEACGAGVPVIATASGGPQEILVEGITGYLVPVGDVETAARRMLALAQSPALATRMGDDAAEHVQKTFSHELFRKNIRAVLKVA